MVPYLNGVIYDEDLDRCDTVLAAVWMSDVAHRVPSKAQGICTNTQTHRCPLKSHVNSRQSTESVCKSLYKPT